MTLEQVVRPFQRSDRRYGKLFVQSIEPVPTEPESAVLAWSASTSVQTTDIKGYMLTASLREENREVSRETRVRRVENADDPSQFVDVEVIDQIDFIGNRNGRQKFVFNNGKFGLDQFPSG